MSAVEFCPFNDERYDGPDPSDDETVPCPVCGAVSGGDGHKPCVYRGDPDSYEALEARAEAAEARAAELERERDQLQEAYLHLDSAFADLRRRLSAAVEALWAVGQHQNAMARFEVDTHDMIVRVLNDPANAQEVNEARAALVASERAEEQSR